MILVVGANGMLGHDIMTVLGERGEGMDIPDIDITSLESVLRVVGDLRPDVVINCAAYTDVDGCETNIDTAMAVNAEGVAHLAMACRQIGALLVHISTDYIFDGSKGAPYIEDDIPRPLSVYGESKLAGEMNAAFAPEHIIVRTQWLYGVNGKNFVETMLKLGSEKPELQVVNDQTGSPTWAFDLANAVIALIDRSCRGTYHLANSGYCTWFDFAVAIMAEAGLDTVVKPISTSELNRPANRPLYSTLDCSRFTDDTGQHLQGWREGLKCYMQQRNNRGR